MRNAVPTSLVSILDALVSFLAREHGPVLDVHAVDGEGLGDGAEGVREESGPGWEEVGEGGGAFEVGCKCECCETC